MDLLTAMQERSSCRAFLKDELDPEIITHILKAGSLAPSPLNTQPWNFIVITSSEMKEKIHDLAQECKEWAIKESGWKWLKSYYLEFLKDVPVIIAVTGDTRKSGMDAFQKDGPVAYQHACAAAIQNMLLAAHAQGISSLWFTMFDKDSLKELLKIDEHKVPLALVCLGKAASTTPQTPRKDIKGKTTYI